MVIDIGVCVSDPKSLESFVQMAQKIGFTGLATHNIEGEPDQHFGNEFSILNRADVSGRGLKSIRKKVDGVRKHSMIVSVKLTSIDTANWAAEDQRVDLLTHDHSQEYRLRDSTARLAATSGTALEIRFEPLLHLAGLNRSKVIKVFRESIRTAIDSGMRVVLSSGATHPLQMRSAMAIQHLGELLGMESKYAEHAIKRTPLDIVERNRRRFSSDYVVEGVEIIQRGNEK
ncbi:MAG: RNase P subunit p30 family protein [Candidatus Thorarchaeota archaeon]|jgi:RNase P/RNase MRP subunit p30